MVGLDDALAGELVERGEAPGARDDGEALAEIVGGSDVAGHEVFSRPWAAMEALSSAKALLPASVLRTLAGEGSSRWRGMDRMTESCMKRSPGMRGWGEERLPPGKSILATRPG